MSKRAAKITVVTLGDLERGESFCDCGKPEKAPTSKPQRLKLGKLEGFGKHCVIDEDDEVVRCFRNAKVAKKIARGFGPGFRVKTG